MPTIPPPPALKRRIFNPTDPAPRRTTRTVDARQSYSRARIADKLGLNTGNDRPMSTRDFERMMRQNRYGV